MLTETRTASATKCKPKVTLPLQQAQGPTSRRSDKGWEALGENALGTGSIGTNELANVEMETDGNIGPGQVGKCAAVAAMDAQSGLLTSWTGRLGLSGGYGQSNRRCCWLEFERIEVKVSRCREQHSKKLSQGKRGTYHLQFYGLPLDRDHQKLP